MLGDRMMLRCAVLLGAAASCMLSACTSVAFAAPIIRRTSSSGRMDAMPDAGTSLFTSCAQVAAVLLGGAQAGKVAVAARRSRIGRAAVFKPSEAVGAMEPLGYFDPLGFCKEGDVETFRNYRAAEIKHGRVAMMAAVGLVAQDIFQLPGVSEWGAGNGIMAATTLFGQWGLVAIFMWSGNLEVLWKEREDKEPGNFGDPLGLDMYTIEMRNKEGAQQRTLCNDLCDWHPCC
ncbi:Light-harvesting complex-like [Amphidinium carterae]